MQDLLQAQYGDSGVTFNLETGVVTLDLGKLLGGNLNNLPGNGAARLRRSSIPPWTR